MRIITALTAAILLAAANVAAAPAGHFRVTAFGSDIGELRKGGGVSLGYAWSPRWSADLSVASEKHTILLTRFVPGMLNGQVLYVPATFFESYRTYPIDVTARYSFVGKSQWTPFAAAGFHHVSAPNTHPSGVTFPVVPGGPFQPVQETRFNDANEAEVIAGIAVHLTPRLSIEGAVRRLLTNSRTHTSFDPLTRTTAGLSWRF